MRAAGLSLSFHSTLSPGEVAATGAKSLSPAAQAALLACAVSGRLAPMRGGWHTPDGTHPRPIGGRTIDALKRAGLITTNPRSARLTSTGHWYARTLCSALAGDLSPAAQGVEP